jgi:hypothetical protein
MVVGLRFDGRQWVRQSAMLEIDIGDTAPLLCRHTLVPQIFGGHPFLCEPPLYVNCRSDGLIVVKAEEVLVTT